MATNIPKSGLSYRKLDLHIHTPASYDYKKENVTAKNIIESAIAKGLDGIAITDHNTGNFIDDIKTAASVVKGKIAVFPGVEISCAGGNEGSIHIIALFDPSKGSEDITRLMGALNIEPGPKPGEKYSKKSPSAVIDTIHEFGGLPICAHANSSHGILNWRGIPRKDAIQNPHLLAAEGTDFDDHEKREMGKRVCDFLNGKDHNYNRKLAVYQSSDSHEPETIGSKYSLFKLEEISLDGLRQCFYDPDVRIRQPSDYKEISYPKITYLSVNQGFLKGQNISFHHGLNCIVGGKGVGKSLIIETIRFALDQCSEEESIFKDHSGKIEKRIGYSGEVILKFELEQGQKYRIIRKFDGNKNPIQCFNDISGEVYTGKIPRIFPILVYSQNEIIKTAENEYAQLQLIDNFHSPQTFYSRIHSIADSLKKVDRDFSDTINAISDLEESKKELDTQKEELKIINHSLENKLFAEMEVLEGKDSEFRKYFNYLDSLKGMINELLIDFKQNYSEPSVNKKYSEDPHIPKSHKLLQESRKQFEQTLISEIKNVEDQRSKLQKICEDWYPELEQKRAEYEKMLSESGGNKKDLESKRRNLTSRMIKKEEEVSSLTLKVESHSKLVDRRNELLDQLDLVYSEFYNARKEIFEKLTEESHGRLKLDISKESNSKNFFDQLVIFTKGPKINKTVLEKITKTLSPRKFVEYVISSNTENLVKASEISIQNANKIIQHLRNLENFEEFLSICYLAYREDTPVILYRKDDDNYYPLKDLSTGQKCTALLIIALSSGDKPIIIDQPEDSLDNPSVYEDIVSKLRDGKENRQFILTTHNSSVGVASDSDNFIIVEGTASSCEVKHCGAIDRKVVRSGIISHLEGGDEPYHLKSLKYNLN
jgi:DNA repair ATPase RecN